MQQERGNRGATKRKASRFTRDELRALFSLNSATACDTADLLGSTLSGADWQVRDTAALCIGSEMSAVRVQKNQSAKLNTFVLNPYQ